MFENTGILALFVKMPVISYQEYHRKEAAYEGFTFYSDETNRLANLFETASGIFVG